MSEPYGAVRAGLASLLEAWPEWRTAPLVLLRNRLLDECGGDARPYIALVIRAAELGVPERILEWGGVGVPWTTLRGSLVVSLTSEAFLRSDMATWVIDTWGLALVGASGLGVVEPPVEPRSSVAPRADGGAQTRERQRSPIATQRGASATSPRTSAYQAPLYQAPAHNAAPFTPRRAPLAAQRGGGMGPRAAPHGPPEWMNSMTKVALGVIVAGVLYLVVQVMGAGDSQSFARPAVSRTTASGGGETSSPRTSAPPLAASPANGVAPAGDARPAAPAAAGETRLGNVARGALPANASEPARLMIVQPPTRATGRVGPGAVVLENQVALLATTKADRLELRSGKVLTGRVEVVRASVVLFRDAESGLRYEVAKADIREITTEFGNKVRFGSEGDPLTERRSPLVTRGVGGTYRVTYAFRDVRGSKECTSTAARAIAPDVMRIEHSPGTDTLRFAIDGGSSYYGVVDGDGLFATALALQADQARESSAYTSRIDGRFTATGFDATFNLIAYRRVRGSSDIACHTTLTASGVRLGTATPSTPRP